jgi:hypothetical protein
MIMQAPSARWRITAYNKVLTTLFKDGKHTYKLHGVEFYFSKVVVNSGDNHIRRWSPMVDIIIGGAILPVQNNPQDHHNPRRQAPKKRVIKDRRKAKHDRRINVRNGVVVSLSKYPERRRGKDRRKSLA